MTIDVISLGEVFVDWLSMAVGTRLEDSHTFTKSPGGACANTAVGLARLGVSTAFVGGVSTDRFGQWLSHMLKAEGVCIDHLIIDPNSQTRMAYIVTTISGDRELATFSKTACADAGIQPNDLSAELFESPSIFHFGSASSLNEASDAATHKAIQLAKQNGLLVSYDPNVRLPLWSDQAACKQKVVQKLSDADVVKLNEDELLFLTGTNDISAAQALRDKHGIPLMIVTLGANGSVIIHTDYTCHVPGFDVKLVEATGAGDGFNAGLLSGLLIYSNLYATNPSQLLQQLSANELKQIVVRANAVGALTCLKVGAFAALPTLQQLNDFLPDDMGCLEKQADYL